MQLPEVDCDKGNQKIDYKARYIRNGKTKITYQRRLFFEYKSAVKKIVYGKLYNKTDISREVLLYEEVRQPREKRGGKGVDYPCQTVSYELFIYKGVL